MAAATATAARCAMISLRQPQELFGAVRDAHREAAAQSAELATGISQGLETVYAATVNCFGKPDVIVMVPWATPPTCVLTSTTQRVEAAANGQGTAWCTLDALDGHIASFPVGAAFLRIAALQQLMSLVMDGVRWGVQAPMQIRIAANLERLDERVRDVNGLTKLGFVTDETHAAAQPTVIRRYSC